MSGPDDLFRRLTGRTAAGVRRPSAAAIVARRVGPLSLVDDPDARWTLIAVDGPLTPDVAAALRRDLARRDTGWTVHLDLSGIELGADGSAERLEAIADRLEARGVRLRVVGLDPTGPA
jgi:hypothetical protein